MHLLIVLNHIGFTTDTIVHLLRRTRTPVFRFESHANHVPCVPEVSMDRIRIGYPAGYLRFFRIRIGCGYLFLKKYCIRIFLWFQLRNFPESDSKCHKWWWQYSIFFVVVFIFTKNQNGFVSYVLHSSPTTIIRVTLS